MTISLQGKMKSLFEDWRNLLGHQKQVCLSRCSGLVIYQICVTTRLKVQRFAVSPPQVYKQLAEDDKVRYKNEITSWEEHMVEIGREDLIRDQTLSKKKKTAVKRPPAKKAKTTAAKTLVRKTAKKPTKKTKKTSKKSA